ncbi:hypothetical protein [Mycobacterium sp. 236(2023)]|uniref:hypothetical protein n=1 Tax=Mycobacterium sp. 236(2023) TaxID=3038163 RepID=UPI00241524B8|nr:hypothetical protein [Mycobacterium sp. 236(2023)]MDG4669003.1 hypothetical protein [Mycobacterium sp. 236(2023)]
MAELENLLNRPVQQLHGQAALHNVTLMARSYTRGRGFVNGIPCEEIAGVIVSAACRLVANPRGIDMAEARGPESVSFRGSFSGWSIPELFVLNNFRERAK